MPRMLIARIAAMIGLRRAVRSDFSRTSPQRWTARGRRRLLAGALALWACVVIGPAWAQWDQVLCTPQAPYTRCIAYSYGTAGGEQAFLVPANVTSLYVKMWGAGGGGVNAAHSGVSPGGGGGGYTEGIVAVTGGSTLYVTTGKGGVRQSAVATFGGGGAGGTGTFASATPDPAVTGGSGGGMSALWSAAVHAPANALLVAGGGGGGSPGSVFAGDAGGGGGGLNGSQATGGAGGTGAGGTQAAGGAGSPYGGDAGSQFQGGGGGICTGGGSEGGGGGGGGWYGGGGGGCSGSNNGGGGGGSGYIGGAGVSAATTTAGGNGALNNAGGVPANSADVLRPAWAGVGGGTGDGGHGVVVIQWVSEVRGTVFEDIAADLLADGAIGGAANPGLAGVTVRLFNAAGGASRHHRHRRQWRLSLCRNASRPPRVQLRRGGRAHAQRRRYSGRLGRANLRLRRHRQR